jgi:hypothetical protein
MDYKAKLDAFRNELQCSISYFNRKHTHTKRRAQSIKICSVCFSAMITVFLGLNANENMVDWFKNLALVLGSVVTIINAVDAFFNYNALWIKSAVTLSKLQELRRNVDFYIAGIRPDMISEVKLNEFLDEFQKILKDDMKQWLKIREKANSMDQNKDSTGYIDLKLRSRQEIKKIDEESQQ